MSKQNCGLTLEEQARILCQMCVDDMGNCQADMLFGDMPSSGRCPIADDCFAVTEEHWLKFLQNRPLSEKAEPEARPDESSSISCRYVEPRDNSYRFVWDAINRLEERVTKLEGA